MKPSLGWDLVGYGDSGSVLGRADRTGVKIVATIKQPLGHERPGAARSRQPSLGTRL
jgi:hypothetical protein